MAICNVRKFPFPNFIDGVEAKEEENLLKDKIKDEYTGKDFKVASDILAKHDVAVRQNQDTQERIDKIKQKYFEKGWSECEKSYQKILEQEKKDGIANILSKIETNLINIYQTLEKDYDSLSKDCITLSYEIANKLAGKLTDRFPEDVLMDFLEKNLPLLTHASSIKVSVNPKSYEAIHAYIEDINKNSSIKVDLIEDVKINVEDCEISWKNGLIKKDIKRLKDDLEIIFKNNL